MSKQNYENSDKLTLYFVEKLHAIKYPTMSMNKPRRTDFSTVKNYADALEKWESIHLEHTSKLIAYNKAVHEVTEEFKIALGKFYDVDKHPKFNAAWSMAWERGHSAGYTEVVLEFESLLEFLS